jgi:hypothetical protein
VGEGEEPVSLPIKIVVNWDKVQVCEECVRKIVDEVRRQIRSGNVQLDLPKILCDNCWNFNSDNGAIKIELDPRVLRK